MIITLYLSITYDMAYTTDNNIGLSPQPLLLPLSLSLLPFLLFEFLHVLHPPIFLLFFFYGFFG